MRKRMIITIIAVVLAVVALSVFMQMRVPEASTTGKFAASGVKSVSLTSITYDNLASELGEMEMIKALPKNTEVVLKFYNFNTGEREWERAYLLEKGKITSAALDTKAEIVLTLHSKYLKGLTNQNLCSVVSTASKAGDAGFESELSKTALLWKFKSMLEYKSCLGL